MSQYKSIAGALNALNFYMAKKIWSQKVTSEEDVTFENALQILREAIQVSLSQSQTSELGSLVTTIKAENKLDSLQLKTTLFLAYNAGTDTSGALLTYILWQLGQHPEYQDKIREELQNKSGTLFNRMTQSETFNNFFLESLRIFTPVYVINREPTEDLVLMVKDSNNKVLSRDLLRKKTRSCLHQHSQLEIQHYLQIPMSLNQRGSPA